MTFINAGTERRNEVSTVRLYVMRALYFLNFAMLGSDVWPSLVHPAKLVPPINGVALAFWVALSTLSALGLRYPLKMLPLFFMQLFYKVAWLAAVALPLWRAGQLTPDATDLINVCAIGAVIDLLVIPWPYVIANFVKAPGDRWKLATRSSPSVTPSPGSAGN